MRISNSQLRDPSKFFVKGPLKELDSDETGSCVLMQVKRVLPFVDQANKRIRIPFYPRLSDQLVETATDCSPHFPNNIPRVICSFSEIMSNSRTNQATSANLDGHAIFASGTFKNVWAGTYIEGARTGERCVVKEFKSGAYSRTITSMKK